MRRLQQSSSTIIFLEEIEYTDAALAADVLTAELGKPFVAAAESWESIFKAERQARRTVGRTEAVVSVRNGQLDVITTRFGAGVLSEAGADRASPFFRRFFPIAPSVLVRQPLRKQCEYTQNVVVEELSKLEGKAQGLKAFARPLETTAKAALAALDARSKAKAERAITHNDVDEWKEGINTLRLSTYAELLKIAIAEGYPRSWADNFFRLGPVGDAEASDVVIPVAEATQPSDAS